jgi:hypothetical protein
MVDKTLLAPALETNISTNVIFEFAKTFESQLRHIDVRICARELLYAPKEAMVGHMHRRGNAL